MDIIMEKEKNIFQILILNMKVNSKMDIKMEKEKNMNMEN